MAVGDNSKGAGNAMAKLSEEDVLQIRGASGITQRGLAAAYGVSQWTVWAIRTGRIWPHVGGKRTADRVTCRPQDTARWRARRRAWRRRKA